MTDQNTRPQPSAEPVAVRQIAQAIDDLEWLSTDGRFNPQLTAVIASALEAARREALEQAAKLADQWGDENKESASKARKSGDYDLAAQLKGAATESHALATAIRALKENTNG